MVQRTEVVKAAEQRARQIVDAADDEARRLRHECEDYCDQKLASFEIVLERTMKTVAAGRTQAPGQPARRRDAEPQAEPAGRRTTTVGVLRPGPVARGDAARARSS